jgi:hypothetical protein
VPSGPETRPRPAACLNCGSTLVEAFCARCGQRNMDMRIPARDLALDAVEDGLSLDSRVARTLAPFLFRPGFLTLEWTSGRRARFSSPLRLYLLTSFVFFLASGLAGDGNPIRFDVTPDASQLQQAQQDPDAAGVPVDGAAAAKEAKEASNVPAGTEEQHQKLRTQGWLGRSIDDRWQVFARMPRQEFLSRINAAFREWVPRVMFLLVPAAVVILALLWRRRWLSEHVVLSLHLHAFAFTVFTVLLALRLLPWPGPRAVLEPVLALALPLYFLLALRRVYGQAWRWTVPKAMAAALLYLVALVIGLVATAGLALYFA